MHLDELQKLFKRKAGRSGMVYNLGDSVTRSSIENTEKKIGVTFPTQVRLFYLKHNGLNVKNPSLKILPLEQLENNEGMIHFATLDDVHKICFDIGVYNNAGQWDIVNCKTGFLVTKTFASFWSNKIWAWLDKRRTIWMPELYDLD